MAPSLGGFNDMPGGTGPTVTRLSTGRYQVNFGVNISGRSNMEFRKLLMDLQRLYGEEKFDSTQLSIALNSLVDRSEAN